MTRTVTFRVGLVVGALVVAGCGGGQVAEQSVETTASTVARSTTAPAPVQRTTTTTAVETSTTLTEPSVPTSLVKPEPGDQGSAVVVTGVELRLLESDPVQVHLSVSAQLPTPCHEAVWSVEDDGFTVAVELRAQSDPGQICTEVIQDVELDIDLGDYPTGSSRSVTLNGEDVADFDV